MSQPTSKKSKPPRDDSGWAQLFSAALRTKEKKPVGIGWMKFDQLLEKFGFGQCKTRYLISTMIDRGEVEVFKGTVACGSSLVRCVWYRQKKARSR